MWGQAEFSEDVKAIDMPSGLAEIYIQKIKIDKEAKNSEKVKKRLKIKDKIVNEFVEEATEKNQLKYE